jgi:hypothetical protein
MMNIRWRKSLKKLICAFLLYLAVTPGLVNAQKYISYEVYGGGILPVAQFAETQTYGAEFSFLQHVTTARSNLDMTVGINYVRLPGKYGYKTFKEISKIKINQADVEFIKLFFGYQFYFQPNKRFYLRPTPTCSFLKNQSKWFRSGLDFYAGYLLPIKNHKMKFDFGTKFGFLNIYGKAKDEKGQQEKNRFVFSLGLGVIF